MDEIVFAREALRRALLATAEALEKTAADYDPEDDLPTQDVVSSLTAGALHKQVKDYANAVAHRINSRAERHKGTDPPPPQERS